METDPELERLRDIDHQIAQITALLLGAPPPPGPSPADQAVADQEMEAPVVSLTADEQRQLEGQLRALQHERDELLRQA